MFSAKAPVLTLCELCQSAADAAPVCMSTALEIEPPEAWVKDDRPSAFRCPRRAADDTSLAALLAATAPFVPPPVFRLPRALEPAFTSARFWCAAATPSGDNWLTSCAAWVFIFQVMPAGVAGDRMAIFTAAPCTASSDRPGGRYTPRLMAGVLAFPSGIIPGASPLATVTAARWALG